MPTKTVTLVANAGLVVLAVSVAGCSDSSDPDEPPGSSGHTTILLTDSPFRFDLVERVDLFVKDVRVAVDTGTTFSPCSDDVTVVTPNRTFEMLSLQRGETALLGEADLPAGEYRGVCITMDTERSSLTLRDGRVLTGSSTPGINWQQSGERILKAELLTPVEIGEGGGRILIDFDVGTSFYPLPIDGPPDIEQGFFFSPRLLAADPDRVGSVAGQALGGSPSEAVADASVTIYLAEPGNPTPDTWFPWASGTTDDTGAFRLALIHPSALRHAQGQQYILEIAPPWDSPLEPARLMDIEVVAGEENDLGEVVLE